MARGKYQRRPKFGSSWLIIIMLLLVLIAGLLAAIYFAESADPADGTTATTLPATTVETTTQPTTEEPTTIPTTVETEPYITSTASVGVSGDFLLHTGLHASAKSGNQYDFSDMLRFMAEYYNSYDFMVANLEVPLAGADRGYSGYPLFNSPDAIATDLKEAGMDMVLTANNHTIDQGHDGLIRTQEALTEAGMQYLGTQMNAEDLDYIVQEINGIYVGMVCYTYETGDTSDGRKTLNGNVVPKKTTDLVTSFNPNQLDEFYAEVEQTLAAMKQAGAEATMLFIHWGNEYELKQNKTQSTIAQKLCELGVDVIVGGHPHVIQPFETLVSSTGHKTYCIYSVGNALSNQNRNSLSSYTNAAYTEDGMIFGVTFEKWNDGSVNIQEITILPTWVNVHQGSNKRLYYIMPLDYELESWDDFGVKNTGYTYGSYKRTLSIVGAGLNEYREANGLAPLPLEKEKP